MTTWIRITAAGVRSTVLFGLALLLGSAHAARPLVTEDAGVLDRGDCEFEGVGTRLSAGESTARSAQLQIACGVGIHTQFNAAIAATRIDGEQTAQAGASGKTALRALTDEQIGVALAYAFIGTRPAGMGWRYDFTSLLGVVSVPVDKNLVLHANLGASRSRVDQETNAIWALAAEFLQVGGTAIDLTLESFGNTRDPLWLSTGIRYTVVPERFSINASFGGQGGSPQARLATLGFKLNF